MGSILYEVNQHKMETNRIHFEYDKKTGNYIKKVTNRQIADVTLQSYRTIAIRYMQYCRDNYTVTLVDKRGREKTRPCKHVEEGREHIQAYADYLVDAGKSPSTVHTYIAALCHFYEEPLKKYDLPVRHTADYSRGRGGKASSKRKDTQPEISPRLFKFSECVGCRRAEYAALKGDDLVLDESGYLCVRINKGKGSKFQLQRILPGHQDLVKSYFSGDSSEYVFTKEEMKNKINLHAQRAKLSWECYLYYKHRLDTEPDYREQLRTELKNRIYAMNQRNAKRAKEKGKGWTGQRWNEREFSGMYYLRGKNRSLAIKSGRPTAYDKAALLAVSVFHLSHYRCDVTIASYILATDKRLNQVKYGNHFGEGRDSHV